MDALDVWVMRLLMDRVSLSMVGVFSQEILAVPVAAFCLGPSIAKLAVDEEVVLTDDADETGGVDRLSATDESDVSLGPAGRVSDVFEAFPRVIVGIDETAFCTMNSCLWSSIESILSRNKVC